jgi:hypothetical protein
MSSKKNIIFIDITSVFADADEIGKLLFSILKTTRIKKQ